MDLILHSFGISLSCNNGSFVVSQRDGEQKRLTPQGISSIQISRGVQITSDAILLALEYEIEVVIVDRAGRPQGRVWASRYGSISTIRKGQVLFVSSPDAVEWIKEIICQKILHQQALLLTLQTTDPRLQLSVARAVSRQEEILLKLRSTSATTLRDVAPQFRGWEGAAAKIYFETLSPFLPEQYQFSSRSQHPALDLPNALFNYAYGMLYGKIEGILIKVGIDPYVGALHRDEHNRPVLVYDIIETYRVWADYVVITLLCQKVFSDAHYSVSPDGAYWLEPLGRRILIQSMNDYLDELVVLNGLNRSRITHLHLSMQQLATRFKSYHQ